MMRLSHVIASRGKMGMQSGFVKRGSFLDAMGRNGPITKCQGETQVDSNKVLIQSCEHLMLIPTLVSMLYQLIFICMLLLVPDDHFSIVVPVSWVISNLIDSVITLTQLCIKTVLCRVVRDRHLIVKRHCLFATYFDLQIINRT